MIDLLAQKFEKSDFNQIPGNTFELINEELKDILPLEVKD
jgi:hypothetical protein